MIFALIILILALLGIVYVLFFKDKVETAKEAQKTETKPEVKVQPQKKVEVSTEEKKPVADVKVQKKVEPPKEEKKPATVVKPQKKTEIPVVEKKPADAKPQKKVIETAKEEKKPEVKPAPKSEAAPKEAEKYNVVFSCETHEVVQIPGKGLAVRRKGGEKVIKYFTSQDLAQAYSLQLCKRLLAKEEKENN